MKISEEIREIISKLEQMAKIMEGIATPKVAKAVVISYYLPNGTDNDGIDIFIPMWKVKRGDILLDFFCYELAATQFAESINDEMTNDTSPDV